MYREWSKQECSRLVALAKKYEGYEWGTVSRQLEVKHLHRPPSAASGCSCACDRRVARRSSASNTSSDIIHPNPPSNLRVLLYFSLPIQCISDRFQWTPELDKRLLALVDTFGENWRSSRFPPLNAVWRRAHALLGVVSLSVPARSVACAGAVPLHQHRQPLHQKGPLVQGRGHCALVASSSSGRCASTDPHV